MSDQTREKEKSLAELMVRILKEPLKPLDASVRGLEGGLSDIKAEVEVVSGSVAECQVNSENAAKRSKEALGLLGKLHDEQTQWGLSFQTSLTEQTQTLEEHLSKGLKDVEKSERRLLEAVASVGDAQGSAVQILASLPAQLSDNRAALDNALEKWQAGVTLTHTAMESGLSAVVAEIGQRLENQHKTAQAVHHALLKGMKGAAEQTQALMTDNLQTGQALHDSLASGQAGIIGALNQHAEALNARLDQSQARLRQLAITTGVMLVSMLVYVGYELLSRFI